MDHLSEPRLLTVIFPYAIVFENEATLFRDANLACQTAVQVQVTGFTVDGDEVLRLDCLQHRSHIFLWAGPGGMDSCHPASDNECPPCEQMVANPGHPLSFACATPPSTNH